MHTYEWKTCLLNMSSNVLFTELICCSDFESISFVGTFLVAFVFKSHNGNTNADCRASLCVTLYCTQLTFIASTIYMMVIREFGPVFCISVSIVKGIMKLTLVMPSFLIINKEWYKKIFSCTFGWFHQSASITWNWPFITMDKQYDPQELYMCSIRTHYDIHVN